MADLMNPLGSKQYGELNKALAKLNEARLLITNATDAGIDVSEQQATVEDLEQAIALIKAKFFPDRP